MSATRRLWARRMIRAGWLLAPILEVPMKLFRLFLGTSERRFYSCFFGAIIIIVVLINSCRQNYTRDPTPEEIKVYLTGNTPALNACMKELIPKWRVHFKEPLSNGQFKEALEACETLQTKVERGRQQDEAIKAIVK